MITQLSTKAEYKYDEKGRVIKTSHYSPNGNFKYGYEYEYLEDAKLTYENPGRILKNKDFFLKEKTKRFPRLGKDKEIVSKEIEIVMQISKWNFIRLDRLENAEF